LLDPSVDTFNVGYDVESQALVNKFKGFIESEGGANFYYNQSPESKDILIGDLEKKVEELTNAIHPELKIVKDGKTYVGPWLQLSLRKRHTGGQNK
jgi:hypothetical protein